MSNVRSNVRGLLSWYEHVLQALSVDDDDDDDDDNCVQRVRPATAKLKVHVEEERNNEAAAVGTAALLPREERNFEELAEHDDLGIQRQSTRLEEMIPRRRHSLLVSLPVRHRRPGSKPKDTIEGRFLCENKP